MIASLDNFFFSFSQNPIRNQEIFTVLLVAIAIDSFCSSFWHQENPKKPSYISLQNKLLRILRLPSAIGQCYDNAAVSVVVVLLQLLLNMHTTNATRKRFFAL